MTTEYQGKVYLSPDLIESRKTWPLLNSLIEAFKEFWRTGHHKYLGKDVPYDFPNELVQSSIRHTHVSPFSSDDAGAKTWLRCFVDVDHERRPTSDRCLIYCVTDRRNCMLITYIDKDAHSAPHNPLTREELTRAAEAFFTHINEYPLDKGVAVFDKRWLKALPATSVVN